MTHATSHDRVLRRMAKTKAKPKTRDDGFEDVFSFRMTHDERAALERISKADGRTPSNMIRKLIAEAAGRPNVKR